MRRAASGAPPAPYSMPLQPNLALGWTRRTGAPGISRGNRRTLAWRRAAGRRACDGGQLFAPGSVDRDGRAVHDRLAVARTRPSGKTIVILPPGPRCGIVESWAGQLGSCTSARQCTTGPQPNNV